jgi:hypothetical protein
MVNGPDDILETVDEIVEDVLEDSEDTEESPEAVSQESVSIGGDGPGH